MLLYSYTGSMETLEIARVKSSGNPLDCKGIAKKFTIKQYCILLLYIFYENPWDCKGQEFYLNCYGKSNNNYCELVMIDKFRVVSISAPVNSCEFL